MTEKPKGLVVVDDLSVKEIYANKFISTMFDGGTLSITMGAARLIPEKTEGGVAEGEEPKVYVTVRLTVSPSGAVELTNNLSRMLNSLKTAATKPSDQKPS